MGRAGIARPLLAAALWLLGLAAQPALGEVYRYRDAEGRWQFSDRPPPGSGPANPPGAALPAGPQGERRDLAARLEGRFRPEDALHRATLAVVAVEGELAQGAGFFVSDTGYILTNRHLVRPQESEPMQERRQALDQAERRLAAEERRYTRESLAQARRELREARRELDWKRAASAAQTSFQIRLKDGETLTAGLVGASESHDLALLKLDGFRTPSLRPAPGGLPDQGAEVHAIGAPLGVADSLTSGRVTSVRQETIFTDCQLLPGNSGGPLVNARGEVLGVNYAKRTQGRDASGQGIGMAVPIGLAIAELPELGPRAPGP